MFPIAVPALADRPEDIGELTRHFLARFAAEEGKRIARVSAEALALLAAYRWPGNVRQLENAVFRAVVLAEGDEVGVGEFPQIATQITALATSVAPELAVLDTASLNAPPLQGGNRPGRWRRAMRAAFRRHPPPMPDPCAARCGAGEVRPLEEIETEAIRFAIAHYRGQMSEVARRLRIGRSTLYRKLDALGLECRKPRRHRGPNGRVVNG